MKRFSNLSIFFLFLGLMLLATTPANAAIGPRCYVDDSATGLNDGNIWTDAYTNLQAAITDPNCDEIWVAAGVYTPGSSRSEAFALASNVALYGGFAGNEIFLSDRNWAVNLTILSGDIDNNDTNTDGNHIAEAVTDIQGANSYHVVVGSSTNSTALLDGFVITAGQGNGTTFPNNRAGGIYINSGTPMLRNLVFSGNYAANSGGAIYNYSNSDPTITNCVFVGNATGGYGGAIDNYSFSDPVLTNVVFSGNTAVSHGGALRNGDSWPTLVNVTFSGNQTTSGNGGALYNDSTGAIQLRNVVIWGNTAGGAGQSIFNNGSVTVNISYSNLQGCGGSGGWIPACGTDGGGNIDLDPFFIDADGADNVVGTRDDNLRLDFDSPSTETGTNTGCPTTDLDGLPRPGDGNGDSTATCDMGAYEAGEMVCGVTTGNAYTFNYQSSVAIIVDSLGSDLACLYVDEMEINHPNATGMPGNNGLATGRYWRMRGLQSDTVTNATNDFAVTLTLPHDNLPNPQVCKYPGGLGGAGWDCAVTTSTVADVTRSGISSFSDWAAGSGVGPTSIQLISFTKASPSLSHLSLFGILFITGLFVWGLLFVRRRA